MLQRLLFFLICAFFCFKAHAEAWNLYVQDSVLFVDFKPNADEKIYWMYAGENGRPTKIDLSRSQNLESYEVLWPWAHKEMFGQDVVNYVYNSHVVIPVLLVPKDKTQPVKINVEISYALCSNDGCRIETQNFRERAFIKSDQNVDYKPQIIVNKASISHNQLIITVTSKRKLNNARFLVTDEKNFCLTPISVDAKRGLATLKFDIPDNFNTTNLKLFSNKTKIPVQIKIKETICIYTALALGFLGGLILNFMPCVLPVLSIKMLSLVKFREEKYRVRIFATLIGIIGTFLGFGIFSIISKNAGNHFGFGFHMQNTYFLIGVAIVITFLISVALDRVHIMNFNALATTNVPLNLIGDVMLGVISTLLATPCTAPFLGVALAFAMTQSDLYNLLIFLFIGLGFSTPYLVTLISYDMIKFIPKSGPWLRRFKKISAYMLVVSLLWVLYILYTQLDLRATAGFGMILIVIKFFVETKDVQFYKRIIGILVLVSLGFYLPIAASDQDHKYQASIEKIWHKFDQHEIEKYVDRGDVVVVDVTASWCSYCQVNKLVVWDRSWTTKLLSGKNIIPMRADITNNDELAQSVQKFMAHHKVSGIPLTVVYGPRAPHGIVIEDMLSYEGLKSVIEKAKE